VWRKAVRREDQAGLAGPLGERGEVAVDGRVGVQQQTGLPMADEVAEQGPLHRAGQLLDRVVQRHTVQLQLVEPDVQGPQLLHPVAHRPLAVGVVGDQHREAPVRVVLEEGVGQNAGLPDEPPGGDGAGHELRAGGGHGGGAA
jgi:hypothetical protein